MTIAVRTNLNELFNYRTD